MQAYAVQDCHGGPHIRVRTKPEDGAWGDYRIKNGEIVVGTGMLHGEFVEVSYHQDVVYLERVNLIPAESSVLIYIVQSAHGDSHIRVRKKPEESAWGSSRLKNGEVVVGTGNIYDKFVEIKFMGDLVYIKDANLQSAPSVPSTLSALPAPHLTSNPLPSSAPSTSGSCYVVQSSCGDPHVRVRTKAEEDAWGEHTIQNGETIYGTGQIYGQFIEFDYKGELFFIKKRHLQEVCKLPKQSYMPAVDGSWPCGPILKSNWVIPQKLLAGGYPGAAKEPEHIDQLKAILDEGVDVFICLMPYKQLRGESHPPYKFNPYLDSASHLTDKSLQFLHAPIPDGHVGDDSLARAAAETIIVQLQQGKMCYVHCWGGNGRTGTIVSIVLARLYGVDPQLAVKHFQKAHATRKYISNTFPESPQQLQQAMRLGGEIQGTGHGASHTLAILESW